MEISVGQASYRDGGWGEFKSKTMVYFEDRPVQDMPKTKLEGRPIFKNRTFIVKITPGDRSLRVERYANDNDQIEFATEWEAYKKKNTAVTDGTPLEAWPLLTKIQVLELKAFNIFTIEQLASLSDGVVQKFMGGQMFRQRAQDFIRGQHTLENSRVEMAKRDERIAELERQLKELTQGKTAKKPGRPKKVKHGTDDSPVGDGGM